MHSTALYSVLIMIKNKIIQFNPGLTQFSPNRGFSPTRVKPGFNPGGGLNLPTLELTQLIYDMNSLYNIL